MAGTHHLIVIGDSRRLDRVRDSTIDLVVTSPPYWNLKQYGRHGIGPSQAYRAYLDAIDGVLSEVARVVRPGRFVCLNVGTAVTDDHMESIPSDLILVMRSRGFAFKKEIIWVKPLGTQGLWQRGVTKFLKSTPFPGHFNVNIMHEYILIFQKSGPFPEGDRYREALPPDFIKKVAWSVWTIPVSRTKGHPAPFPEEIPSRLMRLYSVPGETVLDPFAGSGTTMKAARDLGRNSILYEINEDYLPLIKAKVGWATRSLDEPNTYDECRQADDTGLTPRV